MRIALLGGAFNPPHLGHLMVARQVLDFTDTEEVWFLPNFGQSPAKTVASTEDRLAMTKLLEMPKTRVSAIEIDNKLDGETVHLLPLLPKDHEFSFVIGSDQLPAFRSWMGWEQLLVAMRFYVFPREGFSNAPLEAGMEIVSNELLIQSNISSTIIRKRVVQGLPVDEFVPQKIVQYINSCGLYR